MHNIHLSIIPSHENLLSISSNIIIANLAQQHTQNCVQKFLEKARKRTHFSFLLCWLLIYINFNPFLPKGFPIDE